MSNVEKIYIDMIEQFHKRCNIRVSVMSSSELHVIHQNYMWFIRITCTSSELHVIELHFLRSGGVISLLPLKQKYMKKVKRLKRKGKTDNGWKELQRPRKLFITMNHSFCEATWIIQLFRFTKSPVGCITVIVSASWNNSFHYKILLPLFVSYPNAKLRKRINTNINGW